jgi:hypothetical protein
VRRADEFPGRGQEIALAHAVGNKVEEAYRRGDLFQKRRDLAAAWARYIGGAAVVRFPPVGRRELAWSSEPR